MFSAISTSPKIIKNIFKIPLNPYKIRLLSNSTENIIYNNEITHQKPSIHISSITQNTSKINTFPSHQIHKQYHSIEVIIFIIKFISNSHQKSTPNNISSHYHLITSPSHSLPAIIGLNHKKSTQISIKITSMIKYSSKTKNQNLPSKTQI